MPPGKTTLVGGFMQRITTLALSLAAALAVIPAAHAEAPSSSGVKIGILNDQSGVYADFGGKWSVEAAHMAVDDFGGNVLGKPTEIISADHQNKPDVAIGIARRWYDVENVDAIMELTTSSVALAVQQLSKEKKKITIVDGAATTDLTGKQCTPYGFHWAYDTHALRSAPAARWSRMAATVGSSSPLIMLSATRSRTIQRIMLKPRAARSSAPSGIP